MNRHKLDKVIHYPYRVCEKSDGERAFLLLLSRTARGIPAGGYIIDRSFEVKSFDRGLEYAAEMAKEGPTLLDGELILRQDDAGTGTGAKAVFMMFDCITAGGRDIAALHLDGRLEAIRDSARGAFTKIDNACLAAGRPALPLYMLGKYMVDKKDAKAVLDKVNEAAATGPGSSAGHAHHHAQPAGLAPLESDMGKDQHPATLRQYKHDIRVNGTDGLIFTPSACSYRDLFSKDLQFPLLKWKYSDEHTIDFRLMHEEVQTQLENSGPHASRAGAGAASASSSSSAAGGGATELQVPLHINLGGSNDRQLTAVAMTVPQAASYNALFSRLGKDSLIVECAYDTANSTWAIRRIRDKKTRANFITTAWSTLEAVAENLGADEIVRRLSQR